MKALWRLLLLLFVAASLGFSCRHEVPLPEYKARNIVIIVMDGPRYSESWGAPGRIHIPQMAGEPLHHGVLYTTFYNNGPTHTLGGHTSLSTGYYQEINNSGMENPIYPGIFHYYNQAYKGDPNLAWVIASKDKIDILADCKEKNLQGRFSPMADCGYNGEGTGSGLRDDSITMEVALEVFREHKPRLVLINFAEPDIAGHDNDFAKYLREMKRTDAFVYTIWKYLQTDPHYKGTTAFFYTNDHGRHLDGVSTGFTDHGDDCEGCRHISLYASGPDFKKNIITDTAREIIDIPATVAELFGFKMPYSKGKVLWELFEKEK
jgi:hypothetical protein